MPGDSSGGLRGRESDLKVKDVKERVAEIREAKRVHGFSYAKEMQVLFFKAVLETIAKAQHPHPAALARAALLSEEIFE